MASDDDLELYSQIATEINAVFDKYITGHTIPMVAAVGILINCALAPLFADMAEKIITRILAERGIIPEDGDSDNEQ